MTDLQSTLAAIDAATGCQQCEGPLGESPSGDFCGPSCQESYFSARSEPLVGYQEPVDLAAHINNQVELDSPETTPRWRGLPPLEFTVAIDTSGITAAFRSIAETMGETLAEFHTRVAPVLVQSLTVGDLVMVSHNGHTYYQVATAGYVQPPPGHEPGAGWTRITEPVFDECTWPQDATPQQRALEARRNRNTGPHQRRRAPRRIDPSGSR